MATNLRCAHQRTGSTVARRTAAADLVPPAVLTHRRHCAGEEVAGRTSRQRARTRLLSQSPLVLCSCRAFLAGWSSRSPVEEAWVLAVALARPIRVGGNGSNSAPISLKLGAVRKIGRSSDVRCRPNDGATMGSPAQHYGFIEIAMPALVDRCRRAPRVRGRPSLFLRNSALVCGG